MKFFLVATLTAAVLGSNPGFKHLLDKAQDESDWLVQFRRRVHMDPEIGLENFRTASKVKEELAKLSITPTENWGKGPGMEKGAGLVFDLGTGSSPVVLLRADMDALPITEDNNLEYRSKNEGAMHACGHDAHTTMLLGAAKLLKEMEKDIEGTIRFMFQPGEEGYRGGLYMVEEGVLTQEPKVERALAIHVTPVLPTNVIETGNKAVLAGGTNFDVTITGRGGHAGSPAKARDPIVAGSALIQAFQSLVSRETLGLSARKVGLISVTTFHAGETHNVIPETATLRGTARAVDHKTLETLFKRMEEMGQAIGTAYGVEIDVKFAPNPLPPLIIDTQVRKEMQDVVNEATAFPFRYPEGEFAYGMEDFAFIADRVPTAMYAIGTGSGYSTKQNPPTTANVHDPKFVLDETVLPRGAAFLASGALNLIDKLKEAEVKPKVEL